MSSLVHDLQRDILQGSKSAAELLRMAKVISAKLDLKDVTVWVNAELNGYGETDEIPDYRKIGGGELQCYNPYHGWLKGNPLNKMFAVSQPISDVDALTNAPSVVIALHDDQKYSMHGNLGTDITHWPQQIVFDSLAMKAVVNAVRNRLLDWALDLEKRGITGDGMSFNAKEKQLAQNQTFHIENFTGFIGGANNSNIQIFDYSSIHKTLKERGVPQNERNQLEDVMDNLKTADPMSKKALLEKAKEWVVRNEKVLGVATGLIRKALGFDQ
jgi:hypothetical protein